MRRFDCWRRRVGGVVRACARTESRTRSEAHMVVVVRRTRAGGSAVVTARRAAAERRVRDVSGAVVASSVA